MSTSLLAKSAQGATFLILLQVASRGLTFIVNQMLLRFLSPQILGVATQLELFSITTLYFARESIRVAITRQGGENLQSEAKKDRKPQKDAAAYSDSKRRIQEAVNISWAAINLGMILTLLFEWLYIRKASAAVLETPHLITSLHINGLAVIIELLNEPCFAVSQQEMMYGTRASSEMTATFSRCIITCATAVFASRAGLDVGVLPFAFGQLIYAIMLNLGFFYRVAPVCRQKAISLIPTPIKETGEFIPRALFTLACNFYGQSLFKQLLTSGDQYLIATLTTLASQGAYALASNYGSLLARILFQPIEESSRAVFARLIPSPPDDSRTKPTVTQDEMSGAQTQTDGTKQATQYLATVLHAYLLLGLLALSLGPPLSRPALALVAGARWSLTEAPLVLASYCYYIPLLAFNGVLEAFVAAVATPAQLQTQSLWMVAFSILFACCGFVVLGQWNMGAQGLVLANAVTMVGRIMWSFGFVQRELKVRGGKVDLREIDPNAGSVAVGVGARAVLERMDLSGETITDLATMAAVAGACVLGILVFERNFFMACYGMLQSPPASKSEKGEEGKTK